MATPRVTIDQLPEQAIPEDGNYFVVQDSGVSKKMSWATIKTQPSQPLTDHIADTDDAHDASAISATAAGTGVDGANVQAQLGQLATLVNGKINQSVADGLYVNLTGDTMTGPLILVTDPTGALEAATKQYVDAKVIESGGGISMGDADLRYVNVTGDAMSGALTVDVLISTNTGLVLPAGEPSAADRAARRDYVDTAVSNRVAKAGDTMTGPLAIRPTAAGYTLRLQNTAADPYLSLATPDGTQRYGQLVGGPTQVKLLAEQGDIHLQTLSGAAILSGQTDMKLSLADVPGRAINGWFGFRNPIILPGGYGASDLQGLLCGKGFRFEIGNETDSALKVTNTGFDKFTVDTAGRIQFGTSSTIYGSTHAYLNYYPAATAIGSLGTRGGYMGFNAGDMWIQNETGNLLRLQSVDSPIAITSGGANYIDLGAGGGSGEARIIASYLLVGKASADNYASSGVSMNVSGVISSTVDATNQYNLWSNHIGTQDANGMIFHTFRRTTSGTQIGSITQVNTTGVAFNATSDKQLKTFTRIVDDDESIDALMTIEPVHYLWNEFPELGEQIGFFAQDVQPIAPYAVTEGVGVPGDEDYLPWGMDNSKLIPRMVSAMQAMMRRVLKAESELAELKAAM